MATRRKPKAYRDGGRVLQDVSIADDEPSGFPAGILGMESAGDAPETGVLVTPVLPEPAPAGDNPLLSALHAQQRAEEMQRQAPQHPPPSSPIEHRIEKIPGLSEHKRAFLRQFPVLMEDPAVQAVFNRQYAQALQSGFTDDTPELDNHLITATVREIEHRRQLALASQSVEQQVQSLDDEVEAGLRESMPPAPLAPMPAAPPRRKSLPGGNAPVSRDSPMMSGERRQENTLRPDEREIARVSFPHLSAPQAEYEYLKNKRRMHEMKRDGRIQGDR